MRLYGAGGLPDGPRVLPQGRQARSQKRAVPLLPGGLVFSQLPRKQYEAEDCFKKAIKLDPSKAEYHVNLADLCVKRGLKPWP